VFEDGVAASIGHGEVELLVRSKPGEGYVLHRAGDCRAVNDVDLQRPAEALVAAHERLGDRHVCGRRPRDAERRRRRRAVDRQAVARAVLGLSKGRYAGSEENDGRSREGPSEETHIPNNAAETAMVTIRLMRREDVDAFATWAQHIDPLFRHYNLPALSHADADELWAFLSGTPDVRRPYAGFAGDRMVATLIVRNMVLSEQSGELGIMIDPAYLGRGLGRRILRDFVEVLASEGFRRLHLEVAGYNGRAIAAYRASGFAVCDEYWADPEPGVDVGSLLDGPAAGTVSPNVRLASDGRFQARIVRMERRLTPSMKDDPTP
jgi:RimJ/RimL family protein N-acetyltransferase